MVRRIGTALTFCAATLTATPALAQTAASNPAYFMPPSAVTASHPVPRTTPLIIDSQLTDTLPAPSPATYVTPHLPWYKTDLGVAGIGTVATLATFLLDKPINHSAQTNFSYYTRTQVALRIGNILELAPLAFAGATMVQSPFADPKLAHASSIAVTSALAVTAEAFALKYAVGRVRPAGPNSDPYDARPFDAAYSTFSVGAVFPTAGSSTSAFPSGHTALAFALITPYAELYHNPWLYAIPITVGAARIVAVDGHWASDTVGGAFLGWLTADLTRRFFPNSDYGLMVFGVGHGMDVGISGRF